ncbi:hypothetical protein N9A45_02020 [bacterium]|nr:hypothetical protein [bacterium]
MYRCQSVVWALLSWCMIFAYTLLNYFEMKPLYQIIPIVALFCIIIVLNTLLTSAAKQTKSILIFSSWIFLALIAVLLRTLEVITDSHLNLIVGIFTAITAFIWCIAGHVEDVTESGLYWHVWSILSLFTILCAFNNDSQTAIVMYAINTGVLCMTHILYIRHICFTQNSGRRRCRHLFRTIACLTIIVTLLVGSILYKTKHIDEQTWQEFVIATELGLFVMLLVDTVIGFAQRGINGSYGAVNTDDVDPL